MLYELAKKITPLRMIHTWYYYSKQTLKWNTEVKNIKRNIRNYSTFEKALPQGKKMILLPHSDDEWVGCSQVIMKDADTVLCDMDMPGGDSLEMHKLRKKELIKTAELFRKKSEILSEENNLEKIINTHSPSYILLPFYLDWHPEHIEVMEMVADIIEQIPSVKAIIMYQVSVPMLPEFITHCIPLKKSDFNKKWRYFKDTYKSQTTIPYRRFGCNEKINGTFSSSYAAEVYRVVEKQQWVQELQIYRLSKNEISVIKQKLCCLSETRNYLNELSRERKNYEYRVDTTDL